MKINKKSLESTTIAIGLITIYISVIAITLSIADVVFSWDIFTPQVQKFMYVVVAFLGLLVMSSFILNLMINMSMISANLDYIARNLKQKNETR